MTIIYNINKNNDYIRIFGEDFVKNNRNNCYLIINGKKIKLCIDLNINEIKIENNQLKIKLIEIKHITNMSYMFWCCSSLISLQIISEWNTANVTNMRNMFAGCSSLMSLQIISKWNTANVTNMGDMFYHCSSLISLPDISKWNTANVKDMTCIFYNCSSLKSFPDISKWKLNKNLDKKEMFKGCDKGIIPEKFKSNCLIY